jgi:hypothetical protein
MPLGVHPSPSPLSSHLQNLNGPPPPSISHLHPAAHTNWKLYGLCVFMAFLKNYTLHIITAKTALIFETAKNCTLVYTLTVFISKILGDNHRSDSC